MLIENLAVYIIITVQEREIAETYKMKKLTQWVVGVNILSILWLSLLFHQYDSKISKERFLIIQFLPIILLILFGVSTYI